MWSRWRPSTWASRAARASRIIENCCFDCAGWEDLIDEASEDLEQMEGRVRATTQRLVELQGQATSAMEAVVAQEEARVLAEQQAQHAQAVVQ
eukprot:scaffold168658_cov17-Tisochrysis_lutea.AAC.1